MKGRRAMSFVFMAWMMEELETELWVRPVSLDRMVRSESCGDLRVERGWADFEGGPERASW